MVWSRTRLVTSLTFFSFLFLSFFAFFDTCQVAFLDRSGRSICKTRISGQGCVFSGSRQYSTTFRGQTLFFPQKNSPKWVGLGIFKQQQRKCKIHISRKLVIRLIQNFQRFFEPPSRLRGWSNNTVLQIQDGGRRHVRF